MYSESQVAPVNPGRRTFLRGAFIALVGAGLAPVLGSVEKYKSLFDGLMVKVNKIEDLEGQFRESMQHAGEGIDQARIVIFSPSEERTVVKGNDEVFRPYSIIKLAIFREIENKYPGIATAKDAREILRMSGSTHELLEKLPIANKFRDEWGNIGVNGYVSIIRELLEGTGAALVNSEGDDLEVNFSLFAGYIKDMELSPLMAGGLQQLEGEKNAAPFVLQMLRAGLSPITLDEVSIWFKHGWGNEGDLEGGKKYLTFYFRIGDEMTLFGHVSGKDLVEVLNQMKVASLGVGQLAKAMRVSKR